MAASGDSGEFCTVCFKSVQWEDQDCRTTYEHQMVCGSCMEGKTCEVCGDAKQGMGSVELCSGCWLDYMRFKEAEEWGL